MIDMVPNPNIHIWSSRLGNLANEGRAVRRALIVHIVQPLLCTRTEALKGFRSSTYAMPTAHAMTATKAIIVIYKELQVVLPSDGVY